MNIEKPVLAVHGLQGSGKTYLLNTITKMILDPATTKLINIKSTFSPLAEALTKEYKRLGYELNEAQMKQLMLSVSTYGETFVDNMIWTKEWVKNVCCNNSQWVVVDDIRTEFNIRGLRMVAEVRPVILFRLDVPEEVRRHRLGAKYRENGGYTEVLIDKPQDLPENFKWVDLTENWNLHDIKKHLGV